MPADFYSPIESRPVRHVLLPLIVLVIVTTAPGGCAVFDKSRPGWDEFEAARNADSVNRDDDSRNTSQGRNSRVQLHFETLGAGKPVVLIHGFAANKYTWRYLAPALAKTHKVYLVDLKGFGESPKPADGAYSVYDQAHLILDLIEKQNLRDLTLVGHSFGGGVALISALFLARSMPDVLDKLVLIDTVAYPQDIPFFIELLATPVIGLLVAHLVPPRFQVRNALGEAYYNNELITEETVEAYAAPLRNANTIGAMLTTAHLILPADLDRLSREIPAIDVPTWIIWGEHDTFVPLSVGKRLHEAIDSSQLHVIESCGHIPHEECHKVAVPLIVDFLR